ncbi:MAG TPA: IS1182 family transposase [Thermoanaerobaculaceae bacterium]|nr:IS1182 family transposase [Thermoanaerobaculaceae bacterium]
MFPLPPRVEPAHPESRGGRPRVVAPNRGQVELRSVDLDGTLPADHRARAVWEYVEGLDLRELYTRIRAVEGMAGRPAADPRVVLALWLYATVECVGSARALDRLTEEHDAYRWLRGGVPLNYHLLADFRVDHDQLLSRLLTQSVAALMSAGIVDLQRVAQDGMRVRASAGAASFRRGATLRECLVDAEEQVEALRKELDDDPAATSRRQKAARERAAEDRRKRVQEALKQLPEVEAKKDAKSRDKARVSTTDPDARVMKMGDGGFRPAFNVQFATDTATQVIVGVDVDNEGTDQNHLPPMIDQIQERYDQVPKEVLVDAGYTKLADIEWVEVVDEVTVYAPVTKPKDPNRDPHERMPGDSDELAAWRQRMGTDEAKEIYKERAATAECVNAAARNRGLRQFLVRGQRKVKAVALWYALAHNVMRTLALRATAPVVPAAA